MLYFVEETDAHDQPTPKCYVELREPLRRGRGSIVGVRGVNDTRRARPTESTEQGSQGLTDTEGVVREST